MSFTARSVANFQCPFVTRNNLATCTSSRYSNGIAPLCPSACMSSKTLRFAVQHVSSVNRKKKDFLGYAAGTRLKRKWKKDRAVKADLEGEGATFNIRFDIADYHEVVVQHLLGTSQSPQETPQGLILLTKRKTGGVDIPGVDSGSSSGGHREGLFQMSAPPIESADPDERTLMMHIGGDALAALSFLAQGIPSHRPLALDLLWSVLQQQAQPLNLRLLRVAVVALRNQTFIARLFFGDARTGEEVWQCDARPSDSLWLAGMSLCPVYVHKRVWEQASVPLRSLLVNLGGGGGGGGSSPDQDQNTTVSEPETILKMRRELGVAVAEEDYTLAAKLRDHPFMQMQTKIDTLIEEGDLMKAEELKMELENMINEHESQTIEGHE